MRSKRLRLAGSQWWDKSEMLERVIMSALGQKGTWHVGNGAADDDYRRDGFFRISRSAV